MYEHDPTRTNPTIEAFEALVGYTAAPDTHWFQVTAKDGPILYEIQGLTRPDRSWVPIDQADITQSGVYHYRRWAVRQPDDWSTLPRTVKAAEDRREWLPPINDAKRLSMPNLCRFFADRSKNEEELEHITKAYMDWLSQQPDVPLGIETLPTVRSIIYSAMHTGILDNPDSGVLKQLRRAVSGPEAKSGSALQTVPRNLTTLMANILSKSSDYVVAGSRPNLTNQRLIQALQQLDSAGLIHESLWSISGLQALKATPELLPYIYKKLTSKRPPQLGSGRSPSAQALDYIDYVLRSYAKDTLGRRNLGGQKTGNLIKAIFSGNGYNTGSLNTLVNVANGVASRYPHSAPDALGIFRELKIDMTRGVVSVVPEAFARILAATRDPKAPIEIRRSQLMRDIAQVEVVANLCRAEQKERIACALASLVLNQPDRPAKQRSAAYTRLKHFIRLNGTLVDLANDWA